MTDFSMLIVSDPDYKKHLAFPAFVQEMKERQYGREPLNDAWQWFKSGWEAARIDAGY